MKGTHTVRYLSAEEAASKYGGSITFVGRAASSSKPPSPNTPPQPSIQPAPAPDDKETQSS
jgi:hypothetical protein